jgi:hypothetical protein
VRAEASGCREPDAIRMAEHHNFRGHGMGVRRPRTPSIICCEGPLALLVYRSRFLPRFLGVWLAIDGFAYVILGLTGVLLPQYQGKVFSYGQPAFFGEVAFMLWLSIKGAKPPALDATALSSAVA